MKTKIGDLIKSKSHLPPKHKGKHWTVTWMQGKQIFTEHWRTQREAIEQAAMLDDQGYKAEILGPEWDEK